jgi:hypothetical protein
MIGSEADPQDQTENEWGPPPDATQEYIGMEQALKLIIAKGYQGTTLAYKILKLLYRYGNGRAQARYNRLAEIVLKDDRVTPEDRTIITGVMTPSTHTLLMVFRISHHEREMIETAAANAGSTMSDYIRQRVFGYRKEF